MNTKTNDHKTPGVAKRADANMLEDKSHAKLDREIQGKIGQQLHTMYNEVVSEGIPDRFADLLRRLEAPRDEGSNA